jgi:hypothetical protein
MSILNRVSLRNVAVTALASLFVSSVANAESLSGPSTGTQEFIDGSGSGYTASGEVFLGVWDGSGWCSGYNNFYANSSGQFSSESCYAGPVGSACSCGFTYTVYAYDWTTGTYSNGISFLNLCPQ